MKRSSPVSVCGSGVLLFALLTPPPGAHAAEVLSPDGRIIFELGTADDGSLFYRVERDGDTIIDASPLGLEFENAAPLHGELVVESTQHRSHDESWQQPWGESRVVRDRHEEMLARVEADNPRRHFYLRVRVFDDGVGFRYELPAQPGYGEVAIADELTEFRVPNEATAWFIPGRGWNRYEFLYRELPAREITRAHTPVTLRYDDGTHVSIHEAALRDYAGFILDNRGGGMLKTDLAPAAEGAPVELDTPFVTPWRTVQITTEATGLLNSNLILNLNEPNLLGDVSWVEPGKYVGIWWAMHVGAASWGSGPSHGATTANAGRYVDFAAEYGFDGVLVEGWNVGWDGSWSANADTFSFTEPHPDFDLEAAAGHAAQRGVRLVGHHETFGNLSSYERQMSAAFDLYERHGVRQVKTGYVAGGGGLVRIGEDGERHNEWHDGQFAVQHFERVLVEAAERRISINTHEPVKATGLRRTFPNWISREGARGMEYNAGWSRPNPPSHAATLPYTRLLGGPMDFTPGIFDLAPRASDPDHRIPSTLARQLALYVTIYSPIQMAADLPQNYEARPDAFRFIVDVPTDWEQSIALAGEVGDFVVYARQARGSEDWYVGAITDETARSLAIDLDFLATGVDYTATIYRDGDEADWTSNPYAIEIETRTVRRGDALTLDMAAAGGVAIRMAAAE